MSEARLKELSMLINEQYRNGTDLDKEEMLVVGCHLHEAFEILPGGQFGKWVKANLTITPSYAYNYKWWYNHKTNNSQAQVIEQLREEVRKLREELESLRK